MQSALAVWGSRGARVRRHHLISSPGDRRGLPRHRRRNTVFGAVHGDDVLHQTEGQSETKWRQIVLHWQRQRVSSSLSFITAKAARAAAMKATEPMNELTALWPAPFEK
jgi:hypothetical protein